MFQKSYHLRLVFLIFYKFITPISSKIWILGGSGDDLLLFTPSPLHLQWSPHGGVYCACDRLLGGHMPIVHQSRCAYKLDTSILVEDGFPLSPLSVLFSCFAAHHTAVWTAQRPFSGMLQPCPSPEPWTNKGLVWIISIPVCLRLSYSSLQLRTSMRFNLSISTCSITTRFSVPLSILIFLGQTYSLQSGSPSSLFSLLLRDCPAPLHICRRRHYQLELAAQLYSLLSASCFLNCSSSFTWP